MTALTVDASPAGLRMPQLRPSLRSWLPPIAGLLILLTLWELVARTIAVGRHVVPTIPDVLSTMVDDGFYGSAVATTLGEAGRGFLWGNLAALAVAALCLLAPALKGFLTKLALATYCTPTIALAPLLIVLFSPDQARVTMAGLSVFFPTLLGALVGLEGAPRTALEFVHVSGGSSWFALARIRTRAAVPEIAAALGLAAPAAIVGAMIGEFLGGDNGLGVQLMQAQQSMNVARVWAVAVEATTISALVYLAITAVARRLAYTVTSTESAVVASRPARRGIVPALAALARIVVSIVAVLGLWYAAVVLSGMDRFLAKTPVDIWDYLTEGVKAPANRELIATGLTQTLTDASVGYVAGTVVAILAAVLFLNSSLIEGMFLPVVMTIRAVPLVAMTPIVALVFGRGLLTVAVMAGAVTFVPTLVIVLAALRAVPRPALDLLHVYSVGPVQSLFGVRLAYAIPALAASARIAVPGSILGAVLVELLITGDGIGYTVTTSIARSQYAQVWTALAVLTAVTAVLYVLLSKVESILLNRISQ